MKLFTLEIGTADLQYLSADAADVVDMSDPVGTAFITEFEANVRSPYNHSANAPSIQVTKIVHAGRNT